MSDTQCPGQGGGPGPLSPVALLPAWGRPSALTPQCRASPWLCRMRKAGLRSQDSKFSASRSHGASLPGQHPYQSQAEGCTAQDRAPPAPEAAPGSHWVLHGLCDPLRVLVEDLLVSQAVPLLASLSADTCRPCSGHIGAQGPSGEASVTAGQCRADTWGLLPHLTC